MRNIPHNLPILGIKTGMLPNPTNLLQESAIKQTAKLPFEGYITLLANTFVHPQCRQKQINCYHYIYIYIYCVYITKYLKKKGRARTTQAAYRYRYRLRIKTVEIATENASKIGLFVFFSVQLVRKNRDNTHPNAV